MITPISGRPISGGFRLQNCYHSIRHEKSVERTTFHVKRRSGARVMVGFVVATSDSGGGPLGNTLRSCQYSDGGPPGNTSRCCQYSGGGPPGNTLRSCQYSGGGPPGNNLRSCQYSGGGPPGNTLRPCHYSGGGPPENR